VFIGAGTNDPLSSVDETNELASLLRAANAKVDQYWGQGGHQLTEAELLAAKAWYHSIY
jgi:phospholipase/carboxylesterase